MRRLIIAAFLVSAGVADAAAPPAQLPPPPPPAQVQAPPPVPCVNARDTADYVPGVDVNGRKVAPADLPGSTTDVQISTQVYAEVRSSNPQLRGAGVVVNLPGLARPPICPPQPQSSTIHVH
jgi:hypothetical protein